MKHDFKEGDYLDLYGSVIKVTDKAICVAVNNGKWVGNKDLSKWIPKSALIIHEVLSGEGRLNDSTKHFIIADFKNWFKLK